MTLGTLNTPSDSGYDGKNMMSIKRGAGPFNRPTNVAIGPNGDIYITDGYGNSRVHRFSSTGQLKRSWGEPGLGPGEFYLPHGIAVASDGRVFVCDRESDRIQIFDPDGEYLTEWTDTQRPTHLVFDAEGRVYVTELAWYEGETSQRAGPVNAYRHARMSVFDKDGKVLARWGTPQLTAPGSFAAPHGLALDSRCDLYVSEVTWTFAVSRGKAPEDCHTFQKFALNA
jgi:DNA-binding beta-propeller fold protein YncE